MFSIGLISTIYWFFGIKNVIQLCNSKSNNTNESDSESDNDYNTESDSEYYNESDSGELYNEYDSEFYNSEYISESEYDTEYNSDYDTDTEYKYEANNLTKLDYIIGKFHNKYDKWSDKDYKYITLLINYIKNKKLKRCFKIMLEEYEEYEKNK